MSSSFVMSVDEGETHKARRLLFFRQCGPAHANSSHVEIPLNILATKLSAASTAPHRLDGIAQQSLLGALTFYSIYLVSLPCTTLRRSMQRTIVRKIPNP